VTNLIKMRHVIQTVCCSCIAVYIVTILTRNACLSSYYALNIVEEPLRCLVFMFFSGQKKATESEVPFGVIESRLKATVKLTL
jgi:hypothetical protein